MDTHQERHDSANSAEAPDKLLGCCLEGKLQVQSLIDSGGMSSVYLAKDLLLNRDVAIKVLRRTSDNSASIRRLQQEARALSNLSHLSLAKFLGFGLTADHEPYLIMEYLHGETLKSFIEQHGCLPLETVSRLFRQMAEGIDCAHSNFIVHRDLKPSNIMVKQSADGLQAVIFDFGIARMINEAGNDPGITRTGEVFGSPLYMSPEQCRGDRADYRSDIYSLGCVLYEMLSGHPPFEATSTLQIMNMHVSADVPAISQTRADLPVEIDTILQRMLAKDPLRRYARITDAAFDLQIILESSPGSASLQLPAVVKSSKGTVARRTSRLTDLSMTGRTSKLLVLLTVPAVLNGILLLTSYHSSLLITLVVDFLFLLGYGGILLAVMSSAMERRARLTPTYIGEHVIPEHLQSINRAIATNLSAPDSGSLYLGREKESGNAMYFLRAIRQNHPHAFIFGADEASRKKLIARLALEDRHSGRLVVDMHDVFGGRLPAYLSSNACEDLEVYDGTNPQFTLRLFSAGATDALPPQLLDLAFRLTYQALGGQTAWSSETTTALELIVSLMVSTELTVDDLLHFLTERSARTKLFSGEGRFSKFEALALGSTWDSTVLPLLTVVMETSSRPQLRRILWESGSQLDFKSVIKNKALTVLKLPEAILGPGAVLPGCLAMAHFAQSAAFVHEHEGTGGSATLYAGGHDALIDWQWLDALMGARQARPCWGMIAEVQSACALPARTTETLFEHAGLICAFRCDQNDSLLLARHMVPVESVYTPTGNRSHASIAHHLRTDLQSLEKDEYFAWLPRATAGLFRLSASD